MTLSLLEDATDAPPANTGRLAHGTLVKRFRALTGLHAPMQPAGRPPIGFLVQSAPSPTQIIGRMPIRPRTHNVLRRFLDTGSPRGRWTYGRLLQIPGFGLYGVVDVLSCQSRPQYASATSDSRGRTSPLDNVLKRAIGLIADRLPASEGQIRHWLNKAGLTGPAAELRHIERAARYLEDRLPFAVLRRDGLALAVEVSELALATCIHTFAVRTILSLGLASARVIAFRAGTSDAHLVRTVLGAKRGFDWLDTARDWFWFGQVEGGLGRDIASAIEAGVPIDAPTLLRIYTVRGNRTLLPPPSVVRTLALRIRSAPKI